MKSTGLVLIVIGLLLTLFTAFKFFTKEKVVDLGPVEISRDIPHYLSWSPVIGIVIMVIGAIIVWQGSKKK